MSRSEPSRQQGFGLLVFVIAISVVAFSIVLGYAGMMTRKEANDLPLRRAKMLDDSVIALDRMWPQRARDLDVPGTDNPTTSQVVLDLAGIQLRGGAQAVLSKVQSMGSDGLAWRAMVLYYPSESDDTNPPDLAAFEETGVFTSCANAGEPCAPRAFKVFNSQEVQRSLARETSARLNKVATKAQSYFKARQLQDPERNFSVNYFRKPLGGCETLEQDLGCLDTYTPLTSLSGPATYTRTRMAEALSLTDEELFTAWGQPIEASNLQDSNTSDTPFTMTFRARKPLGDYLYLKAVQQL